MPWVRGHYARRPVARRRNGRSGGYGRSPGAVAIVLIALGVLLLVYLLTR